MDSLKTDLVDAEGIQTGEKVYSGCNNPKLTEQLGQVNYIFTDKTGTITTNNMEFHTLLIGRYKFCEKVEKEDDDDDDEEEKRLDIILQGLLKETSADGESCKNTLRCLSLCHNVLFDDDMNLNSSSPEELEFVKFSENYEFHFTVPQEKKDEEGNTNTIYLINELGQEKKYKLLEKLDFDSSRKRMSIIVENENGEIVMFSKGAGEIIVDLLDIAKSPTLEDIELNMKELAKKGLRVMMIAYQIIPKKRFRGWRRKYQQVSVDVNLLKEKNDLQTEIEKGLILLGAVALEDKLQDKVKETVKFLLASKIKIWVVSGDSEETCKRISISAEIMHEDTEFLYFTDPANILEVEYKKMKKHIKTIPKHKKICSIVTGKYFNIIQEYKKTNEILYQKFARMVMRCDIALFSRMHRDQKKYIVKLVKEFDKKNITLAIGDGANDLGMIYEAHVGVGIAYEPDHQVTRACDFNIGQFKHLNPLLFIFGRECYRKNSNVVLFTLYKNMIVALPAFWFGMNNFYTPNPYYDPVLNQFYNTLFTFFPIIIYGIFDKEYSKVKLLFAPLLYKPGHDRFYFNNKVFITQTILAYVLSFYNVALALALFDWGNYTNGYFFGFINFSNMCILGNVIRANLKSLAIARSYNFLNIFIAFIGVIFFFGAWFIQNTFEWSILYQTFDEVLGTQQFYLYLLGILGLSIFETIFTMWEYMTFETKYIPDFEIRFDANVELSNVDVDQIDLALSGISDHQKDYFYKNVEDESDDESDLMVSVLEESAIEKKKK